MKNKPECTFKAIFLGLLLSTILAAANSYLSLKVGLTIAASIPAAIGAILILRFFKNSSVLECNIIQAMATGAESIIAAAVFTLPAMIILGFWKEFSFFETAATTFLGGFLGCFFSIFLRKIFIQNKKLTFPEAIATAEILILGMHKESGLKFLIFGAGFSSIFKFIQSGLKIFSTNIEKWFLVKKSIFGIGLNFSPALLGVGYLVGLEVTLPIFLGTFFSWMIALPIYSAFQPLINKPLHDIGFNYWETHIRFIGIGIMFVAVIFTLFKLIRPICRGISYSFKTLAKVKISSKDKDIPNFILIISCGIIFILLTIFIFQMFHIEKVNFPGGNLFPNIISVLFVFLMGFVLAVISGYLTGLVGSTNLPISGLSVIGLFIISLVLLFIYGFDGINKIKIQAVSSFVIIIIAILTGILGTSSLNMQCQKVSQIVKATPYKQQLMFLLGTIPGILIIVPILQIMYSAYGIGGVFPRSGMDVSEMLSAPQATLLAETSIGILSGKIPWLMIIIGISLGAFIIIVDLVLEKFKLGRFPVIAFGLGIFLPVDISGPLLLGGIIAHLTKKTIAKLKNKNKLTQSYIDKSKKIGILITSGLIAGESIAGIILAVPFSIAGNTQVLRIIPKEYYLFTTFLGALVFISICIWLYRSICYHFKKI